MGLMSPKIAAGKLEMSQKTLHGHVKDGSITFIVIGRGKLRPRIAFAQSDLDRFEDERRMRNTPAEAVPCRSTRRRKAHITNTISSSNVYAFSALQKNRASEKRAK